MTKKSRIWYQKFTNALSLDFRVMR